MRSLAAVSWSIIGCLSPVRALPVTACSNIRQPASCLCMVYRSACLANGSSHNCPNIRQHVNCPCLGTYLLCGMTYDLCREWRAQLQVVLDNQSVGMLQLQTAFLKTTYMSTLASAQATIAMMLVSAARRECQAIITKLLGLAK